MKEATTDDDACFFCKKYSVPREIFKNLSGKRELKKEKFFACAVDNQIIIRTIA